MQKELTKLKSRNNNQLQSAATALFIENFIVTARKEHLLPGKASVSTKTTVMAGLIVIARFVVSRFLFNSHHFLSPL